MLSGCISRPRSAGDLARRDLPRPRLVARIAAGVDEAQFFDGGLPCILNLALVDNLLLPGANLLAAGDQGRRLWGVA